MPVRLYRLLVSKMTYFKNGDRTIVLGLRDFPSMDDTSTPLPSAKLRSKQFEQNAESIFILPALELRFQTRQLDGKSPIFLTSHTNLLYLQDKSTAVSKQNSTNISCFHSMLNTSISFMISFHPISKRKKKVNQSILFFF